MPFDGNGNWSSTFSAVADRDANIKILASRFDSIFINDIKNTFDNCLTRDGQGKPLGDFNLNNYKVLNVADPTNDQDAVNKRTLESVSGTSINTMLATLYPVGSIYIGTQSTCPLATLIAGSTWQKIEGRYLLASGTLNGTSETYSATNTVNAGLPNITGKFSGRDDNNDSQRIGFTNISGCFYGSNSGESHGLSGGSGNNPKTMNFDASRSSSVYGASTTNRPAAYVVNVWRRTA